MMKRWVRTHYSIIVLSGGGAWGGEDVQRRISFKQGGGGRWNLHPRYPWKGEEGPDSGCQSSFHRTKIALQSKRGITEQVGHCRCVALLVWTVGHIQRRKSRHVQSIAFASQQLMQRSCAVAEQLLASSFTCGLRVPLDEGRWNQARVRN
jgi:hypothetical protein